MMRIQADTGYEVHYAPDIVYAHRSTRDLTLQLVAPAAPEIPAAPVNTPVAEKFARWDYVPPARPAAGPYPLIVECPGSGWAGVDSHIHVPYLVDLARAGFVAAGISYRGTYRDDVVFPAAVQDLKEAVRFLRANADVFHIDPGRVGLLGDSSGGHTVALAALSDDAMFRTGAHLDQPEDVGACCCVYGPVDLVGLVGDRVREHKPLRPDEAPYPEGLPFEMMELWQDSYEADPEGCLRCASPIEWIDRADRLPPFLCVQGDDDVYIPMAQSERFCARLREAGGSADLLRVVGGRHVEGVWTREMLDHVIRFFRAHL